MPGTITEVYTPLALDELVPAIAEFQSSAFAEKIALISRLIAVHPIANLTWGPGWRYRRARKLSSTDPLPEKVTDLIWREDTAAKLGRANPAGYPVLYLSDRTDTAFCEVRANNDDVVVTDFEILPGQSIQVAPIGELARIQRSGRGFLLNGETSAQISNMLNCCRPDEVKSLLITDAFLLECLTNVADDYELSSYVAKKILDKLPSVSAIAYPSRRQFGAINFAVQVEQFWDGWGIRAVRYGHAVHLAQGYYRYSNIRHVGGITNSGKLIWSKEEDVESSVKLLEPLWVQINRF